MDISIRQFRDLDISKIYELIRDVYTTSDRMSETLAEKFPSHESLKRFVDDLYSRPGAIALAAEREERPLGYITIVPRYQAKLRHTSDLSMGVHHSARGQGIGKAMLEHALGRAGESGILEIIYLMVRTDNSSAVRLYEGAGFDQLALLRNDIKTPRGYYDGYLMRRFVGQTINRSGSGQCLK